jgi:RNA polymerase sigma factor (sigma-70 family)
MHEKSDLQLLHDYAKHGNEAAFHEIVSRHTDLVYSAALRQVESSHTAADIAQGVFVDLARKARQLSAEKSAATSVVGWLHRATRYAALNHLRDSQRRVAIERQAMEQLLTDNEFPVDWEQIRPALDEALDSLGEDDRDALLLRYIKNQDLRTVGRQLGVSDDTAQKRVSRALERLREFFSKRGVTVGASGLVVAISANAVQAAPVGLALTISTAAALAETTLTTTAIKTVAMTTLQKTLITTVIVAAVGAGIYEARQASSLRAQIGTMQPPATSNDATLLNLQARLDLLAAQNVELSNELAQARTDKGRSEAEREQARHSAAVFKELAEQASSKDKIATNAYPTTRHVMAGWGKLGRLSIQLGKEDDKLSPEEKAANETARLNAVGELTTLMTAMKQLGMIKPPGADPSAEDPSDDVACLLYGALNLNEQQFGEIYGSLQKHFQEAKQRGLVEGNPTPESAAALQQLADQSNGEIRRLLTPDQTRIFEELSPHIQLGSRKIDFNFKF